jgi:hypothetical protein
MLPFPPSGTLFFGGMALDGATAAAGLVLAGTVIPRSGFAAVAAGGVDLCACSLAAAADAM